MRPFRIARVACVLGGLAACLTLACEPEKPPAPDRPATAAEGSQADSTRPVFDPKQAEYVLTFAAEKGTFDDTSKVDAVPEVARGLVRVKVLGGEPPPAGQVWVANLRTPDADGHYELSTVDRELFEELALGQGLSSVVELPEGLQPPEQLPPQTGIVVYKTEWCGVCKKLEAYLQRKGIQYEAKDIEKDASAAAELQAKADAKGMRTGSVPVIDVRGELMVGFDRARLEKMLGDAT
jgi:glutaredoxin